MPASRRGYSTLALGLFLAIAPLSLPLPSPLAAQDVTRERLAQVDSIFRSWDRPDGPGAAVAVTLEGRIIYSQGYGSAQLEYGIPITPTTIFHVASVSKQFATFAVALLARDGKLSWDDDVRTHLPDLPDLGHPVTLRHLAQHTSGVRDQWELLAMAGWRLDDVITRDQILAMMSRQRELNFEPGSEYLYSNMGYSLLAEVVEQVSGKAFGEFLEERVFIPLGMHATHVHSDHTMIVPGRAYSYSSHPEGGWRNAVLSYANQGATSLFTTAEDLARWVAEMEEPRVGDSELWAELIRPAVLTSGDTVDYALGLSVSEYRGLRTVGHGGADAGFRSHLLHFPEEGLGVVVLGNAASFNAGLAARDVAEVFLEDRMEAEEESGAVAGSAQGSDPREPPSISPRHLGSYAGVYYSPELDTFYRIRLEGDRLVLTHHRHPPIPIVPRAEDSFGGLAWFMRSLDFERDQEGSIEGFRASGGRVRNLLFVRLDDPALEERR